MAFQKMEIGFLYCSPFTIGWSPQSIRIFPEFSIYIYNTQNMCDRTFSQPPDMI
jgi:hypothetical protein